MRSPAYFIPLPLYGSGGRQPRISAATCPTNCLSMPLIMIIVGFSQTMPMPVGIG
jgi:hypothetical protein